MKEKNIIAMEQFEIPNYSSSLPKNKKNITKDLLKRLEILKAETAEDNWNGDKADPIPSEVFDKAAKFIHKLKNKPTKINTDALGGVSLTIGNIKLNIFDTYVMMRTYENEIPNIEISRDDQSLIRKLNESY